MDTLHEIRFPGETSPYRAARDALLKAEIELRKQIEAVAEFRRKLPLGGAIKEDYLFQRSAPLPDPASSPASDSASAAQPVEVRFSELFATDKPTLIIYSFMFEPADETPCTSCNSILDGLNGTAPHLMQQTNFAVVAKSPAEKLHRWAKQRHWHNLPLYSSSENHYNADYHAETPEGIQIPAINVFRKTDEGIFHFYNAELLYAPMEAGQDPRHADFFWPLWPLLDLTPEGRDAHWGPKHNYSA